MFVAYDAFKDPEIARHDVAFRAFVPLLVVGPGEYGKISVVVGKQGGRPSRHLVTFLAEHRKTRRLVVQNFPATVAIDARGDSLYAARGQP